VRGHCRSIIVNKVDTVEGCENGRFLILLPLNECESISLLISGLSELNIDYDRLMVFSLTRKIGSIVLTGEHCKDAEEMSEWRRWTTPKIMLLY